ncbi:MAG: hypothetical protein HAW59_04090 [Betaproteobacteria bacterium]|nr:hypothetical protein [Betaproteobacteria bacterium]
MPPSCGRQILADFFGKKTTPTRRVCPGKPRRFSSPKNENHAFAAKKSAPEKTAVSYFCAARRVIIAPPLL